MKRHVGRLSNRSSILPRPSRFRVSMRWNAKETMRFIDMTLSTQKFARNHPGPDAFISDESRSHFCETCTLMEYQTNYHILSIIGMEQTSEHHFRFPSVFSFTLNTHSTRMLSIGIECWIYPSRVKKNDVILLFQHPSQHLFDGTIEFLFGHCHGIFYASRSFTTNVIDE